MKDFFENLDTVLGQYVDKVLEILSKGWNIIYVGAALILTILLLAGLITALRKFPKFFLFLVFIVAIFCALSFFFYYKAI